MKLGIIGGAGVVGSACAFYAATKNLADEIILFDVKKDAAVNHAMDLDQGVCEFSGTKTVAGDFDDLAACGIILNAVGGAANNAPSRDAYLKDNLKICEDLGKKIGALGTNPIVISATNPIDVLNYTLCMSAAGDPSRFIGYSKNDTLRFKWAISLETGIQASCIDAFVIGEHGEKQVPLYSRVWRKDSGKTIPLTEKRRGNIQRRIDGWFGEMVALGIPRTMGWTSGIGMVQIVEAILSDSGAVFPCSVIPGGEYGLSGLSVGLPARIGASGVKEIVEIPLEPEERAGLERAAEKIKSLYR